MGTSSFTHGLLDAFRTEWVVGHLDSQRAADALEIARRAWQGLGAGPDSNHDDAQVRCAQEMVTAAFQRLAEVRAILAQQFDAFVGAPRGAGIDD